MSLDVTQITNSDGTTTVSGTCLANGTVTIQDGSGGTLAGPFPLVCTGGQWSVTFPTPTVSYTVHAVTVDSEIINIDVTLNSGAAKSVSWTAQEFSSLEIANVGGDLVVSGTTVASGANVTCDVKKGGSSQLPRVIAALGSAFTFTYYGLADPANEVSLTKN